MYFKYKKHITRHSIENIKQIETLWNCTDSSHIDNAHTNAYM